MGDYEKYMREALKEAHKALLVDEVPIGAVVVNSGKIIARAHNLTETLKDPTAHAEMQAITMATAAFGGKYLTGSTIFVTVEPCSMCASALNWAQVDKIVYGAEDPKRGFSNYSPSLLHPITEIVSGVLKEECSEIVKNFFKNKR